MCFRRKLITLNEPLHERLCRIQLAAFDQHNRSSFDGEHILRRDFEGGIVIAQSGGDVARLVIGGAAVCEGVAALGDLQFA